MKNILKFLLLFCFSLNAVFAQDETRNLIKNDCFKQTNIELGTSIYGLCDVVVKSDLCKDLPPEDLLNCKKISTGIPDKNAWSFIKGCATGVFESVKDMLSFIWDVMKWVWGNATSSEARSTTGDQASAIMSSTKMYLHTEYQKAYALNSEPSREAKAVAAMASKIGGIILDKVTGYIKQQYEQLDCLNPEAKSKYICGALSDIFIPPAGALALLKYGPKAASKFPNLKKLFKKRSPESLLITNTFVQVAKRFPELEKVQSTIGNEKMRTVDTVNHPRDIPFEESDGFRPVKSVEMRKRAGELDPEISNSIKTSYNALNDREALTEYFKELHMEAANWMASKGRKADIEFLQKGEITKHAIAVIMIKRLKKSGDNQFTTIKTKNGETKLSHGRIDIDEADLETENKIFRTAIRTGPFIDKAFDESAYGHGIFTHIIQRDIVTRAMIKNGDDPKKLWEFLGTPKGVNFWSDLFDSGNSESMTRPETLTTYLSSGLKASNTKKYKNQ